MLSPDLVPVRRKDGELRLTPLEGKTRRAYLELAEQVVEVAKGSGGWARDQLEDELEAIAQTPNETRIVRALGKLIEDATTFEQDRGSEATERREALFELAAHAWQALEPERRFDRDQVLAATATRFATTASEFEAELFVDLPAAQRVLVPVGWSAEQLVEQYESARIAAVLLRASTVRVTFRIDSVLDVRTVFRTLKFRQLMFEIRRLDDGRHQLTLTGPYSLFESVTKYGLQLALCWPALSRLRDMTLEADLQWGRQRERLRFSHQPEVRRTNPRSLEPARQTEEVEELCRELRRLTSDAQVTDCEAMLDLPGVGLCVPDLAFRAANGTTVYLEVLGYWSRPSVWQRVEMVEAGLVEPVLFVVSNRLRVSEEVLADTAASALYVYRGRIQANRVLHKLNELAERHCSRQPAAPPSKSPRRVGAPSRPRRVTARD